MGKEIYHGSCHRWSDHDLGSRDIDDLEDHWRHDDCNRVSTKRFSESFGKRKIQQIKGVRVT